MVHHEQLAQCTEEFAAWGTRVEVVEERQEDLERRLRALEVGLATLKGQLTVWAAIGSMVGGGIVSVVLRALGK